jgi:hypothetical protein
VPVTFFNAAEDDPAEFRLFLLSRIETVRRHHREAMREIIDGANALLANYEKEQAQDVMRAAARRLITWLDNDATLVDTARRIQDSLLATVRTAHPRTIFASVVREGDWRNLDYSHQLSHGARTIATQLVEPKLNGFRAIADNLLQDPELSEAHDLVRQSVRLVEHGFDQLIRKSQLVGQSVYAEEMKVDDVFWTRCKGERGRGYRDRINLLNDGWFKDDGHSGSDERVIDLVRENWAEASSKVRELLTAG